MRFTNLGGEFTPMSEKKNSQFSCGALSILTCWVGGFFFHGPQIIIIRGQGMSGLLCFSQDIFGSPMAKKESMITIDYYMVLL
jgi:hypothetical protein